MSPSKVDNSKTPSPPAATTYSTSPALIAFTLAVVVICFVGFSIVYFCRCYFASFMHTWVIQRSASGTIVRLSNNNPSPNRGLDPSLLQSFPTFLYSSVKNLRKEKNYSLECAICLLEFEEDSMLRLLTVCYHVFHQECIDLWLSSHNTCPVCRKDLEYSPPKSQEVSEDNLRIEEDSRDHVCIEVKEEEEEEGDDQRHHHVAVASMKEQREQRFARSHSTGHSIVMIRGGDEGNDNDTYTLKLPEHVALKFLRGGHNCTKSCSSYKDMAVARPGTCTLY